MSRTRSPTSLVRTQTARLLRGDPLPYDRLVVAPGIRLLYGQPEGYDQAAALEMPHAWEAGALDSAAGALPARRPGRRHGGHQRARRPDALSAGTLRAGEPHGSVAEVASHALQDPDIRLEQPLPAPGRLHRRVGGALPGHDRVDPAHAGRCGDTRRRRRPHAPQQQRRASGEPGEHHPAAGTRAGRADQRPVLGSRLVPGRPADLRIAARRARARHRGCVHRRGHAQGGLGRTQPGAAVRGGHRRLAAGPAGLAWRAGQCLLQPLECLYGAGHACALQGQRRSHRPDRRQRRARPQRPLRTSPRRTPGTRRSAVPASPSEHRCAGADAAAGAG